MADADKDAGSLRAAAAVLPDDDDDDDDGAMGVAVSDAVGVVDAENTRRGRCSSDGGGCPEVPQSAGSGVDTAAAEKSANSDAGRARLCMSATAAVAAASAPMCK